MNGFAISMTATAGLLWFIACYALIGTAVGKLRRRQRLDAYAPVRSAAASVRGIGAGPSKLARLLHAIRFPLSARWFVAGCLLLFLLGTSFGAWVFGAGAECAVIGMLAGLAPLLWARMKLASVRVKLRLEFLSAAEVFYQAYRNEPSRNVRAVLERLARSRQMPSLVRPYFDELHEDIALGGGQWLARFRYALNHPWGHSFCNMLEAAMQDGALLDEALRMFIRDMRRERHLAVTERNRLLEIRLANFSAPAFLLLFLAVNLHFNYEQSVRYYFVDPGGRQLLFETGMMIFASFVMGLMLRIKNA